MVNNLHRNSVISRAKSGHVTQVRQMNSALLGSCGGTWFWSSGACESLSNHVRVCGSEQWVRVPPAAAISATAITMKKILAGLLIYYAGCWSSTKISDRSSPRFRFSGPALPTSWVLLFITQIPLQFHLNEFPLPFLYKCHCAGKLSPF